MTPEFTPAYGSARPLREVVETAAKISEIAKIADLVDEWRTADRGDLRPGPTPKFSETHVLTLMLVLALSNRATTFTEMRDLITMDDGTVADVLGYEIPISSSPDAIYACLYNSYRRFLTLIDPAPESIRAIISKEELRQRIAARDLKWAAERQRRGHLFLNRILHGTWMLLPRAVRRAYKGDVVIDATVIPAPCQPRSNQHIAAAADPEASWYIREGDHDGDRVLSETAKSRRRRATKVIWGREAHTLVAFSPDNAVPTLALTATLDNPGKNTALNARLCVRALEDLYDVPPGHFVSDRAYLPHSKPEDLALPLRASGYKLVFDYDRTTTDLGVQASNGGAVLVDGTWYCPSMPESLRDASILHLVTPRTSPDWIDAETYAQRIEQRARYELHIKEHADDEGYVRRQCPAVGQSATVSCPRREPHAKGVDRPRARVLPILLVTPAPKVCTQKTMTFAPADGAKREQAYPYQGAEWKQWYAPMRNTVESNNKSLKDGRFAALDDTERRPRRGWAATLVVLAMLMAATNVRKITSWTAKRQKANSDTASPAAPKRARRREATRGYSFLDREEQAQAPPPSA